MRKGVFVLCCAAAAFFAGCGSGSSNVVDGIYELTGIENPYNTSGVMLQGFSWESCKSSSWWNVIKNNAEEIKSEFEYVWFPPCSDSYSDQGYLPRELYDFDAAYGTEEQLQSAINARNMLLEE